MAFSECSSSYSPFYLHAHESIAASSLGGTVIPEDSVPLCWSVCNAVHLPVSQNLPPLWQQQHDFAYCFAATARKRYISAEAESAELGLAVSSPPLAVGTGDIGWSVPAGIAFNHCS